MTRQRPRRLPLRLAKDGKIIPPEVFATKETNPTGDLWRVHFRAVRRLLEAGATIVVDRIDETRAPARNRLSMPWSWGAETEAIPAHAWVHWLPPRPVALRETGAEFSFQAIGGRFAFGIDTLPLFRDLIARRKSPISDLRSRYGHLPVEKSLLQLVRFGIVAIADDPVI